MKLEWAEARSAVRVPNGSISTTKRPETLGQVEVGGVMIPPWYGTIALLTDIAGAYHGYKRGRKHPVWNAIAWSFAGWVWPITIPVMIAQGFGKPSGRRSNPRRRRRRRRR